MSKSYKITFSVFQNTRLKKVNFHGIETFPLYIRVVFNRESIFLKSYYFDLYEQPRYLIQSLAGNKVPTIGNIIEKENELIAFILKNFANNFSLDVFKKEYHHYSKNILLFLENSFCNYLITFFNDEGLPIIASMISNTSNSMSVENLLADFKSALKPSLYAKLLENAISYAPPYIPLIAFTRLMKNDLVSFLPVYVWENEQIQKDFSDFLEKKYPMYDKETVLSHIKQLI